MRSLQWLVGTNPSHNPRHFPELKNTSQNPKTLPRIKKKKNSQNPKTHGSGKCFGFWDMFLDSGTYFWILESFFTVGPKGTPQMSY